MSNCARVGLCPSLCPPAAAGLAGAPCRGPPSRWRRSWKSGAQEGLCQGERAFSAARPRLAEVLACLSRPAGHGPITRKERKRWKFQIFCKWIKAMWGTKPEHSAPAEEAGPEPVLAGITSRRREPRESGGSFWSSCWAPAHPLTFIEPWFRCDYGFNIHTHGLACDQLQLRHTGHLPGAHRGQRPLSPPGVCLACAGHALDPEQRREGNLHLQAHHPGGRCDGSGPMR